MARGKKKEKELTPEEKLQQVLVPESEQPYKVPENWCWVKLGGICFHISDGSHNPPKDSGKGVPLLSATNIHDRIIDFEQTVRWITDEEWVLENERTQIEIGDILLTIVATIGRVAVVTTGQHFALQRSVATIKPKINSQYLSYFFESPYVQTFMNTNAKGTAQKGFYLNSLENLFCAVPPLPEQQRIVDRIESLFAKLDEAKEKAQAVVDGFEDRKAAILHKAFTGELTEEWRKNHNIGLDSWKVHKFDDCIKTMQNGISKRRGDSGEPYVVLRLANLSDDGFDESDLREIVLDEKEQKNYKLLPDDVLMIRVNGSKDNVGKQYRISDQNKWAFCDHIIRIKYVDCIIPQYMVFFSKSEKYKQYIKDNMVSSAGQNTISRKGMAKLQIPIPKKAEQEQISSTLTSIFEKEQYIKEAAEQVIVQIDTMKKSILARAFRGELGTNDPFDEGAEELLKRIIK